MTHQLDITEGAYGPYEKAQENKRSADAAKKQGDMFAHHLHMADHHDNLAQWHGEKGRHGEADRHAEKSEKHHEEAMKLKESVELDEAVKLGSKVKIHAPGKDYHDQVGHVGEIRHGAFKGAAKTYTVDYADGKSIQLNKKNVKLHTEEVAANNVGGGNIAGTQGDAGKKAVMTKEPLKRKKLKDFKQFDEETDKDPCWKNYKMVGMKDKNGKKVPNCVPKESDLNESRGFTKPRGHTEIDAKEYNEILKARENSGHKNYRQSDIRTDSVTGKVAHTRISHDGGQAFHGIPGVERHYDHATGKSKYYKQNLVKKESVEIDEAAVDAKGHKSSTGGLTQKGRDYYNNKTGGNLQAPVTTPPSKLDPDSKPAKRRKSFCARMGGMPGPMKDEKGRPTRKALALRKWNC